MQNNASVSSNNCGNALRPLSIRVWRDVAVISYEDKIRGQKITNSLLLKPDSPIQSKCRDTREDLKMRIYKCLMYVIPLTKQNLSIFFLLIIWKI